MFTTTLRTLAFVALAGQALAVRLELFNIDYHPNDGFPSRVPIEDRAPLVALTCQKLDSTTIEDHVAFREHCKLLYPQSIAAFDCQDPPAGKGNIWCGYEYISMAKGSQNHDTVWVGIDAMEPNDLEEAITNYHNKPPAMDAQFWNNLFGNNNNQNPQEGH